MPIPLYRMKLTIRNMVCDRCRTAVHRVLEAQGLPVQRIELGEVELQHEVADSEREVLRVALQKEGFDLVDDREAVIKGRVKLGEHLSALLHKEYSGLSALFTQVEGITIEQYFLLQRLERVKELIKYGELTMSEIADRVGFSSVAHLSTQFKKLTGMTPTAFKEVGGARLPLDQVG